MDKQVLHYQLETLLGVGGMGSVYRARDSRDGGTVALKFLKEHQADDPVVQARLEREAAATRDLEHPHIARTRSLEWWQGQPLLVMELYEGETLDKRLKRERLTVTEALELASGAASGLEAAHARGLVHHDIKPGNLLLSPSGVIILDFGIARAPDVADLSASDPPTGTLAYMAPEVLKGLQADGRADLWALGVLLYEGLAGVKPFFVADAIGATMLNIMTVNPTPLRPLRPEVPKAFETLLWHLLAKDPASRYPDATQLRADLGALQRGEAPRFNPPPLHLSTHTLPSLAELVPHNLPRPASLLIGRAAERDLLRHYLKDPDSSLVSILGLGGSGKTHLALEAAYAARPDFPDGVYWVALEHLDDPQRLPLTLANTLGVRLTGEDALADLITFLKDKRLLLVLDNLEQLLEGVEVLPELLEACPRLKLLVTSRVRLNLEEEWVLPLRGLLAPPAGEEVTLAALEHYPALALFLREALRVKPDFAPTPADVAALVTLSELLQGSPLGLLLAAAALEHLSLSSIIRAVRENADALEVTNPSLTGRHRSLRAVFLSSWNLLNGPERDALAALSVFAGGFSSDELSAVTGVRLPLLAGLVDASLVQAHDGGRYSLHPLLRAYVREKLEATPERHAVVNEAHARYYLGALALERDERRAFDEVKRGLDNLRAAWRWSLQAGALAEMRAAVSPLRDYFRRRARFDEGLELFAQALTRLEESPETQALRAELMVAQAWLAYWLGRYQQASLIAKASLSPLRSLGETLSLVHALHIVGHTAWRMGNYPEGIAALEEARPLAEKAGNLSLMTSNRVHRANLSRSLGDYDSAEAAYQAARRSFAELAEPYSVNIATSQLVRLLLTCGRLDDAAPLLAEVLEHAQAALHDTLHTYLLHSQTLLLFNLGQLAEAQTLSESAYTQAQARGQTPEEAAILLTQGRILLAQAQFPAAAAKLEAALSLLQRTHELPVTLETLAVMAALARAQGHLKVAASLAAFVAAHPACAAQERQEMRAFLGTLENTQEVQEGIQSGEQVTLEQLLAQFFALPSPA